MIIIGGRYRQAGRSDNREGRNDVLPFSFSLFSPGGVFSGKVKIAKEEARRVSLLSRTKTRSNVAGKPVSPEMGNNISLRGSFFTHSGKRNTAHLFSPLNN